MAGRLDGLVAHVAGGQIERAAGDLERARPAMPSARGHEAGIALHIAQAIGIDAELGIDQLHIGRLVPLPRRGAADDDAHPAIVIEADLRFIERNAERHFEIAGDAETEQPPTPLRGFAPRIEPGLIGRLQCHVERVGEIGDIDGHAQRRLVREAGDEVLAPELDGIDTQIMRRHVHQALDQIGRFRPPGAAIGIDRHHVGEHRIDRHRHFRDRIVAARRDPARRGRHDGRVARKIGPHIGERPDAQGNEAAVRIEAEIGAGHMVAAVHFGR